MFAEPSGGALSRAAGRTPWLKGLPREVQVLVAIAFCVALGFGIVIPTIPVFAKSFGVSAFLAVAVVSVFAFMRLVGAPIAGGLVNRLGERWVLSTGLIVVAVSSALAGFSQAYSHLLILRGIGGLGSAMFTVSAMALLLRTAGPAQRGRAASAFQAGFLFGAIAGPAVGGLVVGISIRAPFFVYAATLAVATAVALRHLHSPEQIEAQAAAVPAAAVAKPDASATDTPAPDGASPDGERASTPLTLGQALRSSAYRAALATNLTNGWISFGLRTTMIPLFVTEALHQSLTMASVAVLIGVAFQAVVLVPAGRISDHRGRRPAMIIGVLGTLVGMVMLTLTDSLAVFFIGTAVLGCGSAFLGSAPAAVVGDVIGAQRGGTVVASYQMISDVGSIVGPLLAGLVADNFGFSWAFSTGVAICAIALLFTLVMPETLKSPPDPFRG